MSGSMDVPAGGTSSGAGRRDPIPALLAAAHAEFHAAVALVPPARRGERPGPDRWSAAEVAEHLSRVEHGIVRLLETTGREPVPSRAAEDATSVMSSAAVQGARSRARRIDAPDRTWPTGRLTPEEAFAQHLATRARLTAAYAATDPRALDGHTWPHPFLGVLTLRGWVELAAHHESRHAEQVREIAAALGPA